MTENFFFYSVQNWHVQDRHVNNVFATARMANLSEYPGAA